MENTIDRVRRALYALLQRDGDDAFVIFEDQRTQKFVQFAGSSSEGLLLDLPLQALTGAERERAAVILCGGTMPDDAGGACAAFQVPFHQDVEAATAATMQVFLNVYGLPLALRMVVTEN
jgi:hypothetical protein